MAVGSFMLFTNSTYGQLAPSKRMTAPESATDQASEDKNKESSSRYETYYNAKGEKEIRAYKYGFQLKNEKKDEARSAVQYEKTTNSEGETSTSAYKWGFQYKTESRPSIKMSTPATVKQSPSTSGGGGSASSSSIDSSADEAPAAPSGDNSELRNKVLEMIKSSQAGGQ